MNQSTTNLLSWETGKTPQNFTPPFWTPQHPNIPLVYLGLAQPIFESCDLFQTLDARYLGKKQKFNDQKVKIHSFICLFLNKQYISAFCFLHMHTWNIPLPFTFFLFANSSEETHNFEFLPKLSEFQDNEATLWGSSPLKTTKMLMHFGALYKRKNICMHTGIEPALNQNIRTWLNQPINFHSEKLENPE